MTKAKRERGNLGIAQAIQETKEKVTSTTTSVEDLKKMKVVELDLHTLVEYPDNEEIFGNLEGQEFEDLKESIKQRGFLQPIVVRPFGDQYQILAGHQRTRAGKANGEIKAPAVIKNVDDDEARMIWLETNIRGRHLSQDKLGKAMIEAEKLLNKKRGTGEIEHKGKTAVLIAEKFDMSVRSVEELLMITKKVAESAQKLGIGKSSLSQMAKLGKSEQEALITILGEDTIKELTAGEIQKAVEVVKTETENLENTYKKALDETQKELDEKEKQLNRVNTTFETMRKDVGELTTQNADIKRQIEEEKSKRLELQNKLESADMKDKEALQKQINEKDSEINKMLMESIKLTEKAGELEKRMEAIKEEKESIEKDFKNLEHDYKTLYEQNRKALAENEDLKKKLEEASKPPADYETMKKELEEMKKHDKVENILSKTLEDLGSAYVKISGMEKLQKDEHKALKSKIQLMVNDLQAQLKKM